MELMKANGRGFEKLKKACWTSNWDKFEEMRLKDFDDFIVWVIQRPSRV